MQSFQGSLFLPLSISLSCLCFYCSCFCLCFAFFLSLCLYVCMCTLCVCVCVCFCKIEGSRALPHWLYHVYAVVLVQHMFRCSYCCWDFMSLASDIHTRHNLTENSMYLWRLIILPCILKWSLKKLLHLFPFVLVLFM